MVKSRKRVKLEELHADDFMKSFAGVSSDDESDDKEDQSVDRRPVQKKKSEFDESDSSGAEDAMQHKANLEALKKKDPEFYKYLQENDEELLRFTDEGEDDDEEEEMDEEQDETKGPKKKVKFDSSIGDDSDDDVENAALQSAVVTPDVTAQWSLELRSNPNSKVIAKIITAFKSAMKHASGSEDTGSEYVVQGSIGFNAIMKLCLVDLLPAFHKALRLPPVTSEYKEGDHLEPAKSRHWKKFSGLIRHYLTDIIRVVSVVADESVVCVLLKHILLLIPFYTIFPKITKTLLKRVIKFWSTGAETVRVLAFLCIVRLGRSLPSEHLEHIMKQMYVSFVKNAKFTTPSTWPQINFMKQSIVELFSLDQGLAYTLSFVYIRQLAIHLRNAITVKKKDAYQAVYNWQYVHSVLLWLRLVYTLHPSEILQPLIYPLIQVTVGTIRLIPAAKYLPLRFHLTRGLIKLSERTKTHLPVLPLLLEVFDVVDMHAKHKRLSLKPLDFSCALKLSKSQLEESGLKDAAMSNFQELLMEYLATQAHTISFPELVLPLTMELKTFLKNCAIANYNHQIKQILEKVEETSNIIRERRKSVTFTLSDLQSIDHWEEQNRGKGTPLVTYYMNWKRVKQNVEKLKASSEVKEKELDKQEDEDGDKPAKSSRNMSSKKPETTSKQKQTKNISVPADEEMGDIIEDLQVSSDEDEGDDFEDADQDSNEEEEDTDESEG